MINCQDINLDLNCLFDWYKIKEKQMINLTEFIGQKLNNKQQFSSFKDTKQDKQARQDKKHFHDESFLQKSLGLSTILDLQNQQQNFAALGISKIVDNNNVRQKPSKRNIDVIKNTKDELEEMKQRRKKLQQKVNYTLSKQQFSKNIKGKLNEDNYSIVSSQNQDVQMQNSQQNSSYSQSSFNSSKQYSSEYLKVNSSQLNKKPDRFLSFLRKDINKLKCQKFLHFIRMFISKWLIKNISQWIGLSKIIQRQQTKLFRFVFISWKRHVNEQNRKLIMAEMIRKRIQQKKNQFFDVQRRNQQDKNQPKDLNNSRSTLREFSPIRPNTGTQEQQNDHQLSYYEQYSCVTDISVLHQKQQQYQQQQYIK